VRWPPDDRSRLNVCRLELALLRDQLRTWATESREGGWSTHQVDPMRRKADEIDELLSRTAPSAPGEDRGKQI
jgi:hypothetical protein